MHGHGKIANIMVSDTYPTRHVSNTDTNVSSIYSKGKKKKNHFLIQFFYFDVEFCLFKLFLWVSSLLEIFCSYFKQYFIIFKLILTIFPNISLLLHTFLI